MNSIETISGAWAMEGNRLAEMLATYRSHLASGKPIANTQDITHRNYIQGDVAVIPLVGVLAKRMNFMMTLFGGTSTEDFGSLFAAAVADPTIKAIVIQIDSPGGSPEGAVALAEQILKARGTKPIIAFADGTMCSAAYWIGCSADSVYAASAVSIIGSIGVVYAHVDLSGREAQLGYKTTEITAGKYKRIAGSYSPLSAEGRSSIQEMVDYYYSLFVAHVAKARGTTEQAVVSRMADGRVFIGQQAVAAGLIDGIMNLDECIKGASAMKTPGTNHIPVSKPTQAITDDRSALHQSAKRYQVDHPGTDYFAAVEAVMKLEAVQDQGKSDDRIDLHRAAKRYQADHPGTDYMTALKAVAPA